VRERVKEQKSTDQQIAAKFNEEFKTYYNYIRPHQALTGKTLAEVAGLI
jgi:transposase InsO family protein